MSGTNFEQGSVAILARRVNDRDGIYSGNQTSNMTSMDGGNAGNAGAVGSAVSFIYGENNRLKEAGLGGSPLAAYTYNGRGERVKKLGATTTYYYYDSNGQLIAELDGSGNTVREYVYLDGQPLALITGGNIYTMHTDHLGTPQVITDASQAVVWQADYKPFGEATMTTELVTNNLRFPGQYFDGETGLSYNYFRYYDPTLGRYITSDPIGLDGGLNTYLYVDGNSLSNIDSVGLSPFGYIDKLIDWLNPKPLSYEECAKLREDIYRKNRKLSIEIESYDPISDGIGGHYMSYGTGKTKPGGHYHKIKDLQRGLKRDLKKYNQRCRCDDDDNNNPPITKNVDAIANQSIPEPIIATPEGMVPMLPRDIPLGGRTTGIPELAFP